MYRIFLLRVLARLGTVTQILEKINVQKYILKALDVEIRQFL